MKTIVMATMCLAWAASALSGELDYARDVRPILSDNCYRCHGPDEKARKASLRLDLKESAFRNRDGVKVIVPGEPAKSELIRRIETTDEDDLMPPPESKRKLTQQQIATLRHWVQQGARWDQHWAFIAPARHELPPVKNVKWPTNGIDHFILARLEAEGLAPSPRAAKERLIRRISLDLTGLPPTPAEVAAFAADETPGAYAKVVDRLLASPRYGERMAADWLDVARYADTHGFQMDRPRAMWAYRDWVIGAFNRNLRFDDFVTWQLAGDLLPNATKEQRLATAFNRLHLQSEEGGIIEEEFRVAYVVDRVNTFGTAFLGLTMDCTRCHDHKFDPLTMKDYYSLSAFFQNIDESGQTTFFTSAMPVPTLLLSTDAQDHQLAELNGKIQAKEKELVVARTTAEGTFNTWQMDGGTMTPPKPVAQFALDKLDKGKATNSTNAAQPGHPFENPKPGEWDGVKAMELTGENGFTFPGVGHFSRADGFSLAIKLWMPEATPRAVVVHHSKAPIDAGSRGYELLLEDGHIAFGLHHMWPRNSLKVRTKETVPAGKWTHVTVTYDGSSRASGVHVYLNGKPAGIETIRDGLWKDITYEGGEAELAIGHRFRDNGFKGGRVAGFAVYDRELTGAEVGNVAGCEVLRPSVQSLREYYLARVDESIRKLADELHSLRLEQAKLINPIAEAMVMEEMPSPRPAYILKRGAYDAHGDQVGMDTPKLLPPFPAGQPRNRLGLARWLVSPENPLTARVIVNRAWQMMFGRGIVESSENFGSQGSPPTHPDLLDWLSIEFINSGWDYKALLKRMALSATYQQDSRLRPDLIARDAHNDLLARGPVRRLTAEMLRDQALAVSDLLVEKPGGPSVRPYQPPGLWEEIAMGAPHYNQSHGPDLYRRSVYTFWKRTVPHPAMITFDAADRNVCVVRRQNTSTPLQALALLDDVQYVEAGRLLGQRMLKEGGDNDAQRVRWAFLLVTSRTPTDAETSVMVKLLSEQRAIFVADPASADKLITVGEAKPDPAIDKIELAAATMLGRAILNHDEAVMRR